MSYHIFTLYEFLVKFLSNSAGILNDLQCIIFVKFYLHSILNIRTFMKYVEMCRNLRKTAMNYF